MSATPLPLPSPLPSNKAATSAKPSFDHERLTVYHAAIDFITEADTIIRLLTPGRSHLSDQLHRASTSIVLNITEGAGEYKKKEKARFYRMARRSATECAAILDVISKITDIDSNRIQEARKNLIEIVAMLTRMAKNLEEQGKGEGKGKGDSHD
ncbi:MAG TPA: four helix bundle protein [Longimicrobiaceae bacterium]|nr:four helix bundle protein [Longimicrobiaceae bacterium]